LEDIYQSHVYVDNILCCLDIVDTAGHEEYSGLRDQYIKSGEGFLLFYSITSQISFNATTKLRKTILKIKEVPQEEEYQVYESIK
jgi:GTPase KRas protein